MGQVRVDLERVDDSFHFVARNRQGFEVHVDDAAARPGGVGLGASPMQLLLVGLAGCAGLDVAVILRKARRRVDAFRISVTGDRADGVTPSPFERIALHFAIDGDVEADRVGRAVRLSLQKYCSAAATLRHAVEIRATWEVNGEHSAAAFVLGSD